MKKSNSKESDIPYWDLEEYRLGMYDKVHFCLEDYLIEKSIILLSDPELFFNKALKMIGDYTNSSRFHLNNNSINRQAWIGQTTCFFNHLAPEYLTKKAWVNLSSTEMIKANQVADRIIKIYETKNKKVPNQMGIGL